MMEIIGVNGKWALEQNQNIKQFSEGKKILFSKIAVQNKGAFSTR
jgi:hypothetical protein